MKPGNEEARPVTLIYLSIGSGHLLAARALGDALSRENFRVQVQAYDPLERLHPAIVKLENLGLALSVRFARGQYDRHWRKGSSPLVALASAWRFLHRHMPRQKGGAVIATHVFPLRMAIAFKRRTGADWRIYGVVTDYGAHGYWPTQGVDGYFVAHEDVRDVLIRRGVAEARVHASGIPLRLDFDRPETWEAPRAGGPLRVAFLAGGVHSGAYTSTLSWFVGLTDALAVKPDQVRISVVTGNRVHLMKSLEAAMRKGPWEVNVRGLVHDMAGFMRSHDLLLAKPGGLAVAESLACGLPLACLNPGPGQETANADFLARYGLFLEAFTAEHAAQVIERAVSEPGWLASLRRQASGLGKPGAARDAARRVLGEME